MAESDTTWSHLDRVPALPPPPGVQSNFESPETRDGLGRIFVGLTYGLMLVFLALRIYTRMKFTRALGVDDYLSLAAGASITAYTGLTFSLFGNPLGRHQWDVRLSHFNASFLERTLSSIVLFALSALFVKTALLVLYLRVFSPDRSARIMIWAGITTIVVFYIVTIIINIRFCVPISMTTPVPDPQEWAKKLKASTCSQPVYNLNAAVGLFGVVSDLYVLIIPVSMVFRLRLPRNRKLGIQAIFLTGLLAVALSLTSATYRFAQLNSFDFTWDSIPSYTLRAAELNIGLICSCLPVVFVIFKKLFSYRPWSSAKSVATPRPRTPSHAYIADLNESGQLSGMIEEQLPRYPAPTAIVDLKTFIRRSSTESRSSQSTYAQVEPLDSNYHGQLIDSG
ncbi:hypothetical protein HD806DRAFT_488300 [Xylariaceae sp. AK1471]|nr:hypothetical protein HD806DRAFT_488300 [Xylariaceae sp. AK1471]